MTEILKPIQLKERTKILSKVIDVAIVSFYH